MYTGYVITAVKKDGLRHIAFDNNKYNTYKNEADAISKLNSIVSNYTPENIKDLIGTDLRIDTVECYDTGDSTRTVF